jgi:hypothetical protein
MLSKAVVEIKNEVRAFRRLIANLPCQNHFLPSGRYNIRPIDDLVKGATGGQAQAAQTSKSRAVPRTIRSISAAAAAPEIPASVVEQRS